MKELFVMITLALGVAIGFVACGDDDDDKTDTVVDAGVVATDTGVDTDAASASDAATGSAGSAGAAGAGGSAGAAGSEAE